MVTLYEYLIDGWTSSKSKAQSTLSKLIGLDEQTQKYILADYVYAGLNKVYGDIIISTNEHDSMFVYKDETVGIICPNHALTHEQITKINVILFVSKFPNIEQILKDIRDAKQSKIPELPESVYGVIRDAFSVDENGEGIINIISRERLSNVASDILYRGLPVYTDYHTKTFRDVALQIKNNILKDKLIKESLPTGAEIPISMEIGYVFERLKDATKETHDEFYRRLGF